MSGELPKEAVGQLLFTVGLPRSGKSTWCRNWVQEAEIFEWPDGTRKPFRPRAIVSGDDVRHAIHGHAYLPAAEALVFCHMDVMARSLLTSGFDVIIDETCTTEETIKRYLRISLNAEPIFIDTPEEECIRRAHQTNKPFLVEPIQRLARQLDQIRPHFMSTLMLLRKEVRHRKTYDNMSCGGDGR